MTNLKQFLWATCLSIALTMSLMADDAAPSLETPTSEVLTTPAQETLSGTPKLAGPDMMRGGMGGFGGIGGMGGGGPGYNVTWYPTRSLTSGGDSLGLIRQKINAGLPIWTEGPNILVATVGFGNTHFETDAKLPVSGRPIPKDLWSANLGLGYLRRFDNGWMAGAMVNVGSSSDKLFNSTRETTISFIGFLQVPAARDGDFWRFSLMYSPNGLLNFPIPGVAYQWNPSEKLSVGIGLPLTVNWRPTEDWTLSLMYIPIATVNARLSYRLFDGCQVYTGFEWLNEGYFLADREDRQERFLLLEKRLVSGVNFRVFEKLTLDLNAGYAFDREYGLGRNQGINLQDAIEVKSGAFLGASLRLKF